jgi:hypothetical protein
MASSDPTLSTIRRLVIAAPLLHPARNRLPRDFIA